MDQPRSEDARSGPAPSSPDSQDANAAAGMPKGRLIVLVAAIAVGVLIAAIPLAAGVFSSSDDQAQVVSPEDQQGMVGAGDPAGKRPGEEDDGADEDGGPAQPVSIANPRSCPAPNDAAPEGAGANSAQPAADSELAGIELPCLTSGKGETADLGQALAGKPTVINVWAWWCEPCRAELPHFDTLAQEHPEWNVIGVHLDKKAQAGADFMDDLGVKTLPAYEDSNHTFDTATELPKVVPITLVYNPDGTRAKMYPQVFREYEDLEDAVESALNGQD